MPKDTKIKQLIINTLTQAQYDNAEVQENELYLTPETPASATNLGPVKVDGVTITADEDGTIHAKVAEEPDLSALATKEELAGCVEKTGDTMQGDLKLAQNGAVSRYLYLGNKAYLYGTDTGIIQASGTLKASQLYANGYEVEVRANRGVANGYAPLDNQAKVPMAKLPYTAGENITISAEGVISVAGGTSQDEPILSGPVTIEGGLEIKSTNDKNAFINLYRYGNPSDNPYLIQHVGNLRITTPQHGNKFEFTDNASNTIVRGDYGDSVLWETNKNAANGVAGLDANGKISSSKIPVDGESITIDENGNLKAVGGAGTGQTVGEVFFSQSELATDNPGALPLFTGETVASANTLYPGFWAWIQARPGRTCTAAEYQEAVAAGGCCAKYATKFPVSTEINSYQYDFNNPVSADWGTLSGEYYLGYKFGYMENNEFVESVNKTVYTAAPIALNENPKAPAFIDKELTKRAVLQMHSKNAVGLKISNLFAFLTIGQSTESFPICITGNSADDINSIQANGIAKLANNYAYTTETVTVVSYEENGSLRLPLLTKYSEDMIYPWVKTGAGA